MNSIKMIFCGLFDILIDGSLPELKGQTERNRMKVLVLGSKGQLGTELCISLEAGSIDYVGVDKDDVNITMLDSVVNITSEVNPDIIINCAAYTQVDKCETEIDLAYAVNAIGARNAAIAAEKSSSKLIHISTDFVYDGHKRSPYYEFDEVNPISMYGKTKLAGEMFIKQFCKNSFIIRTSWLYGHHGANFVKTMLRLSESRSELSVVHDQVGTPTYVNDLVDAIIKVMSSERYGVYHFSNEGKCSWNEFAKKIFELSGKEIQVNEITGAEFGAPAERPSYSVMEKYMFRQEFDYKAPDWETSLKVYLNKENLLKEGY